MAVGTRTVLALIGGVVLSVGVFLHATGRKAAGLGAFAVGFLTAGGWALMSAALARQGAAGPPAETYLAAGVAALTLALYFAIESRKELFGRE
ncbi:hypothetical protein [Halobaculum sp. D14]|uniref:hypothetical protein n=1 Tax=unclassified Halobaculum TaxID=2640896 RepID=UPI003EB7E096